MRTYLRALQAILLLGALGLSCLLSVQQPASFQAQRSISSLIFQGIPSAPVKNFPINTTNSVPNAIINGADNHTFWFTEYGAGKIGEFDSSRGVVTHEYFVGSSAMLATLAIDGRGLIWFTDQDPSSPSVWSLNSTSGRLTEFPTGVSPSDPIFVLVDPSTNNVWFTDYYGNYLGEISSSTPHQMTKHSLPSANSYPVEMVKQNGTAFFWVTEATGKIARFDTSTNTAQEFNPSIPISYPVGVVVTKDGNVWVSEHGGSSVTEFMPNNSTWRKYQTSQATVSPGTGVATLAMDQQGRLWFAEHYSNRIGRLDPATGEMEEFDLPIPGAYSLLDSVDANGNFWFTEATANEIGMIPGTATTSVSIRATAILNGSVTAGSSTQAAFTITNENQTGSITLSLNVTSSFTTNYYTTKGEVSLSNYTVTLGPGQTKTVTVVLTPDFSLPAATYSAGIVASDGNLSSIGTVFLQVNENPLYMLETLIPYILIAVGAVLLIGFLVLRQRRKRRMRLAALSAPKTFTAVSLSVILVSFVQGIGLAWGKCPGLPPPPGGGPDPYGIALDVGSVAFFALVAYFLIRSKLRGQNP